MNSNLRNKYVEIFGAAGFLNEDSPTVTRSKIVDLCKANDLNYPQWISQYSTGRNMYDLREMSEGTSSKVTSLKTYKKDHPLMPEKSDINFIPEKFPTFVPFGCFDDLKKIIKSGAFFPAFVTGLSGNGKTRIVTQACAELNREMFRLNVTVETDEDDLLGGFRLYNGSTVWEDGPVIKAMERGAILLLDEVDLGTPRMMALQPVLEGNSIYVKKINRLVKPAPGFNIIATANTKGKGSTNGVFIGTSVMNEAFLDRFSVTFEQGYPTPAIEKRILSANLKDTSEENTTFVNSLVEWADIQRTAYNNQLIDEIITTRRLIDMVHGFEIFGKKEKAMELGLNRFDKEIRDNFIATYVKLDQEMAERIVLARQTAEQNNSSTTTAQTTTPIVDPSINNLIKSIEPLVTYLNDSMEEIEKMGQLVDYVESIREKLKQNPDYGLEHDESRNTWVLTGPGFPGISGAVL